MVITSPRHLAEIPATAATRIQEVHMSRMFHRVFAASAIGAAALAAPGTALAATAGAPGGAGAQTPTSIVVHLPEHVRAGQPIPVIARVIALDAVQDPGAPQSGKGGSEGKGHGKSPAHPGTGKGHGGTKSGGGHHRKGGGHGKAGAGHGKGHRHAVTGQVVFFLDGRAEPPAELDRGMAGEKIDIPVGRHTLVAEYTGDAQYESARSTPVTFVLTPGQTTTTTGGGFGEQPLGGGPVGESGDDGQDQDGYGQDQGGVYGQGDPDGQGVSEGPGVSDGQGEQAGDQDGPVMGFPDQGVHDQDGQDAQGDQQAADGATAV
jgi:hypothetical protein